MFAFWVALAATCGALGFGILAILPWAPSIRRLSYGITLAASVFGAVLGRQMAYALRPELFAQGAPATGVTVVQGVVFGLGLAAAIVSLVAKLIYTHC